MIEVIIIYLLLRSLRLIEASIVIGIITNLLIKILNYFNKIYCCASNSLEDCLINTNINNLQLSNHYYEYKINYLFRNKDFIQMLDIFIEDIKYFYFKEKFITFTIIIYEFNNNNNIYTLISKPFIFEYVYDHYISSEMLFDKINWMLLRAAINLN